MALETFGRAFLAAFEDVNAACAELRHVAVPPLSLSTITFTGTLSRAMPVDDMRAALELAEALDMSPEALHEFALDCDVAKSHAAAAKRRRTDDDDAAPARRRFRYQLPLQRRGKSVKVFHNGSVHVTGCGSPLEFLEVMDALRGFVDVTVGLDAHLVSFDIQMVNTMFVATDPATRRPLTVAPAALLRRTGASLRADFDTERHPAVKLPLTVDGAKRATVCVFQTGSVSIMGARSPGDIAAAFRMATGVLDRHAGAVCRPGAKALRNTTSKAPLTLVEGYPFNLHSCCLF